MKIETEGGIRRIYLSDAEAEEQCKPGEGDNTCIWGLTSPDGFECAYYDRPISLFKRWVMCETLAKRCGCDQARALNLDIRYLHARIIEEV